MILISQGPFTFELTLAGLLEDILTRYKDERILLSLSDPAIGIRGDLFIAESTIFAARVEKPTIEGYAALRNLCQFAGAEFVMSKYELHEPDPAKRYMSIDLAKLIKSVPSLPVDPSSLVSSEVLMPKSPSNSFVGTPVLIAVPPMPLPPLPPPGRDFPDEQSSSSAKERMDQAFEAALQRRAAAKGQEAASAMGKVLLDSSPLSNDSPLPYPQLSAQAPPNSNVNPAANLSKLAQAAAMLASVEGSSQSPAPAPTPAPMPFQPLAPAPPLAPAQQTLPQPIPPQAPAPDPGSKVNTAVPVWPSVIPQNAVGIGTGDIDWRNVRQAAKQSPPVSKPPTANFSLAEQIQRELSASDEEVEPIKRQAVKKSFVGPLAVIRLFVARLGRLVLPLAIITVLLQGGKLWLESHGGSAALKMPYLDFLIGKSVKHSSSSARKDSTKTGRSNSHRDNASHSGTNRSSSAKSANVHGASAKTSGSAKDASKKASANDKTVGADSNKYQNSRIMRDSIKPAVESPPPRHAYQTAPDSGGEAK